MAKHGSVSFTIYAYYMHYACAFSDLKESLGNMCLFFFLPSSLTTVLHVYIYLANYQTIIIIIKDLFTHINIQYIYL